MEIRVATDATDSRSEASRKWRSLQPVHQCNALKRYALGTKNKSLQYNPDGGLTIYLGNKSPGKEKESNWLPAPAGEFSIWLRAYWPGDGLNPRYSSSSQR